MTVSQHLPVPDNPDKKIFLMSAKKVWDAAHPGKKRRAHDQRIVDAVTEVLSEWSQNKPYTQRGIVKRVKQKFESRKEPFSPVESSILRYTRLFLVLLQPFHRQGRSKAKDLDWVKGERGMPKSEAAIRHVGEAVVSLIPYVRQMETEEDRLYKTIANLGIKLPNHLHEEAPKLHLAISHWLDTSKRNPRYPSR